MKKINYLIFICFIFLLGIVNINAKIPETKNRNEFENLGVNKKWNITNSNRSNVLNSKYVNADEKIYDFSNVLTDDEYEKLKREALEFKEHTNMEIIILIDNLPYSYDKQNEDYAADFYDYNDFGLNLDKYSGVLLFRNTYESDPYYDIYTFGNAQLYFNYSRLNTTLDKTQFLCDALILLCEPFTIKFKISFLNVILLLFPDIVKEFIEPFIIKVESLFWYV